MGKSDSSTFPLRLSQAQRKAVAGELPDLAIRLLPDQPNPRDIAFTLDEMKTIASKCEQAASEARTGGVVRNSLHIVVEAARKSYEKFSTSKIHRIRASERLYQLRISLRDITPEIWRRIQVKECTLDKLHERIQTALGWTNSHLHRFRIDNQLYGDPMLMQENFFEFGYEDSTNTQLGGILPRSGERFRFDYDYDFGDSWSHSVLFEGCLRAKQGTRYPLCVEGERACPPEDVGGTGGYYEYLKAMADPEHERHEEFMLWRGSFDAEEFSAEAATKRMRHGLPDWRKHAWI